MSDDGDPTTEFHLPAEPIDRMVDPIPRFLPVESASGVVLLLCAVAALVLAKFSGSG